MSQSTLKAALELFENKVKIEIKRKLWPKIFFHEKLASQSWTDFFQSCCEYEMFSSFEGFVDYWAWNSTEKKENNEKITSKKEKSIPP